MCKRLYDKVYCGRCRRTVTTASAELTSRSVVCGGATALRTEINTT